MIKTPKIVILTGAGISAESGLSTFRAQNGLWEGYDVNDVATYEGYNRNPIAVHSFYNMLRRKLQSPDVKPNLAHFALAELEHKLGSENVLVVTQNVDNLHEIAGSKNIIHMHGELLKVRNEQTGQIIDCLEDIDYQQNKFIRPHIVWFGEIPLQMDKIYDALSQADYFIFIGKFCIEKRSNIKSNLLLYCQKKTIQVTDNKQVARIPLTKRRFVGLNVFDISRHISNVEQDKSG